MSERIEQRVSALEKMSNLDDRCFKKIGERLTALEKQSALNAQDISKMRAIIIDQEWKIAKLEKAVKFKEEEIMQKFFKDALKPQPTCKTCMGKGTIPSSWDGHIITCPDCVKKHQDFCPCVVGGKTCICDPAPKTSCEHEYFRISGTVYDFMKCAKCGNERPIDKGSADPQPERTLEEKFNTWSGRLIEWTNGNDRYKSSPEAARQLAQIAEEHQKPLLLDAEAKGYSIGRKEAIEELRKMFEEALTKLFNG